MPGVALPVAPSSTDRKASKEELHQFLARVRRTPARATFFINSTARPPCICTFELSEDVHVLVCELDFKAGGVGMRVTPSALFLAQWMLQRSKSVEGARSHCCQPLPTPGIDESCSGTSLLELGCGLALNGLAAAAMGASRVVLTDYSPRLLHNVKVTIATNVDRGMLGRESIAVALCDWAQEAGAAEDALDRYRQLLPRADGSFPRSLVRVTCAQREQRSFSHRPCHRCITAAVHRGNHHGRERCGRSG